MLPCFYANSQVLFWDKNKTSVTEYNTLSVLAFRAFFIAYSNMGIK
ncbi:hypothetical protein PLUTE_a2412 [Pseudoalteromonas luteoviolacea DSM 6061]|nr:hypothetical protein [Pseudoalteromonas luteoviolacea DSM 6061]